MSIAHWFAQLLGLDQVKSDSRGRPAPLRSDRQSRLALYNTYEARTLFSELIDRARDGEEIVIGRSGEPMAKLVPYGGEKTQPGMIRAHVYVHDRRAASPGEVGR